MNGVLPVSAVIAIIVVGVIAFYYMAVLIPSQGQTGTRGSETQTTSISQAGQNSSSAIGSPASQTATTFLAVAQTTRNLFNTEGRVHLFTVTPRNNTFTLTYNATTWYSPVTLTFNQSKSYAQVYTNGTQWVSTSQPCKSNPATSSTLPNNTSRASVTTTITVTVDLRCGQPPNTGWNPVNGTLVDPRKGFTPNEIQVSLKPTTFAANYVGSLQVTVTLNLKPGVYEIALVLGVQTGSSFGLSDLVGFLVNVKSQ